MSAEFLLTTLVVVATPGTGVVYTLAAALSRGRRASVIAAFGCTLGTVPHAIAALTGLAALLHTSAIAFQTIKYLGVAYLIYMAIATFRQPDLTATDIEAAPERSDARIIRSAVLVNLLNPKLTIFFFAFLPQFIGTSQRSATLQMAGLSAVFMLVTFGVFVLYGIVASTLRSHVLARPRVMRWTRRVFAGSFLALSARLAAAER